jgi:hypothetical protein
VHQLSSLLRNSIYPNHELILNSDAIEALPEGGAVVSILGGYIARSAVLHCYEEFSPCVRP